MHILADVQRITLNMSSSITILGGRTEQLDITAGFLPHHWLYEQLFSFIDVEHIWFFHGALHMMIPKTAFMHSVAQVMKQMMP